MGSHTTDFGAYSEDPLRRTVGAAVDMTQAATTHDLAAGTSRATKQIPGVTTTPGYLLIPVLTERDFIRSWLNQSDGACV